MSTGKAPYKYKVQVYHYSAKKVGVEIEATIESL